MGKLSVVIAAYNEKAYLPDQLEAIRRQRIKPDEIVFVDDGSTDSTAGLIRNFVEHEDGKACGARLVKMGANVGCAGATNLGVSWSTGDHLYIASANDVVRPGAFAAIKEAIRRYPGANIIAGDVNGMRLGWGDESGNVVTPSYLDPDKICKIFGPGGIIHAAGAVISRAAWDHHGGWDADFWPYSETLTWHVTAARFGVVYVPWCIADVRQHPGSASKTVLDREWRRPLMERAVQFVMGLEEPARSRLIGSRIWDIAEWAPDMAMLLASQHYAGRR